MSKNLSFLMLLMVLFAPWAANAQNRETITIGTGTSTNYYPLPGFYGWQYDVYLYTPSDASALNSDCSISSIAFNVSSNSSTTGASMEIWVKDVDASYTLASSTTFSTYTSGATKVYNNTNFSSASGWNTLSFSSSFSHTGGKALLVAVRGVGCSTSGGCSRSCHYTSASNSWWYKHTDGTTDPGTSASGTVSSNRANIQLEINGGGGGQGGDDDCDLSEDFDGVTGTSYSTAGSMPSGWYSYTTATGSSIVAPHVVSGSSYNYYHSSSQSLGMESGTNANNTAYAVMPAIASGKTYSSLSFYYRQESTSSGYGTLTVGYVMAQTSTGCSNFVPVQDITASTTLHEETVDVSSVPANAYLAFRWIVTSGSYYACGIDDVCVTTVSSSGCPTPTSLAIVDNSITIQGATFTWNGTSDSYLVMVKESSQAEPTDYTYGFEDGWQGWTTLKGSNGDSPNNWHHSTTHVSYDGSTGDVQDWSAFGHNSSSGFMISESYISSTSSGSTAYGAVTPDNYLVSPQVSLGGSISFYAGARNTSYCAEKFSVMVSTTNNTSTASFTTVQTWILSLDAAGYTTTPYTVDLSAYAGQTGYIAIRHWDCYDQWVLCIDDITIDTGEESPWTTYPASASPFTINDLNPGTTYDVKVIGLCDGEESNASTTINFTTDIACPAPTEVTVSNITGHEATVTWTGSSDSYIVKYSMANFIGGIPEEFGTSIPSGWEMYTGLLSNGTATMASASYGWNFGTGNGVFDDHARVNIYGNYQRWLVMPATTVPAGSEFSFDLALTAYSGSNIPAPATTGTDDKFIVLISTDNMSTWTTLREWNNSGSTYVYNNIANTATGENVTIDLSTYAGQNVRIAFYGESTESNADNNLHIDNVAINTIIPIGEWQTVTTEEVSVTLTGLDPETLYEVVVQGDCGEEGLSSESNPATFTTEVSCPAPTNLNVTNISGRTATINWTGSSDNYIVMIGAENLVSNIDFETGDLSQAEITTTTSYPWTVVENTHSGTYCAKSGNGFTSNSSDLVLEVTLATETTLSFSAMASSESGWDYGRFLIDDTQQFETSGTSNNWTEYSYLLTSGSHTLIWRYYKDGSGDYGDDCFYIDDIVIKAGASSWTEYTTSETTYTFDNLSSNTSYQVKVKGDCGEEGMSAESEPVTFITDVTCPAPHDLRTSDITSNSAMLQWEGDAESYNVSYYKAYFFDSFEEDLSQWTIIKEGDDGSFEWGIENPHDNSADLNAHGGNYAAVAYSDTDVHADNWLITPQITMPTQATLKFWVMRSTYDDAQDEYEVRLSTTGNAVEDFDVVLQEKAAASSTWTEVSIDLSEYDGQQCYIAIHHDFTSGFFIMVDDFGIFGWSELIATTGNSLLIEDLLPETEYLWHVQANCGEEDGLSQWASIGTFTTLKACPVPFDLNVSEITANGATIAWTGYSERYEVLVSEGLYMAYDFENHTISDDFANSSSYPWTVVQEGQGGSYCLKSGNGGISNSTSAIEMTIDLVMDATLSFDFWSRGEGSNDTYDWDKSRFYIDGTSMFDYASHSSWESYSTTLTAGTHTLKWEYKKDGSTNPDGDCFYVDNITIESVAVSSEMNYTATESPLLLNDASYFLPETTYLVKVKGICGDEETEYSEAVTFTTLDENTKIFVIEGDWSDGDNWVPAGVPSIEQDVILRAEATVFDVAEANIITIDDAGALIIEDGGQLKTNADVEATMKKFIIGYGTDYVETNDGYYLMTLPIADPISAADAGLLTEESEYDLYSWDRTATDEEWQNNHDGIDMQNGAGYLYANQDDMEMSFTATLRNSSESIVVTPAYDEVEHGGWNLYGNPFPCEAYITTDAEDMTFYRLVGNQLELIEGAIAPLEAFFVKATAAGQTFTISREVPAK